MGCASLTSVENNCRPQLTSHWTPCTYMTNIIIFFNRFSVFMSTLNQVLYHCIKFLGHNIGDCDKLSALCHWSFDVPPVILIPFRVHKQDTFFVPEHEYHDFTNREVSSKLLSNDILRCQFWSPIFVCSKKFSKISFHLPLQIESRGKHNLFVIIIYFCPSCRICFDNYRVQGHNYKESSC